MRRCRRILQTENIMTTNEGTDTRELRDDFYLGRVKQKKPCWAGLGLFGLLSESLVQPSPLYRNCTYPEWAKGLAKSLWTPHIQHTPSLNYYHRVDTTELWAPERPDTETVSSPKQSISWTLDIKRGIHNTGIHYLFTSNTYFFILNLHKSDLTHNCSYCILCFCHFVHCLFVYLYIVLLLSVSCHVAVILLHCGASVTITNPSYV